MSLVHPEALAQKQTSKMYEIRDVRNVRGLIEQY